MRNLTQMLFTVLFIFGAAYTMNAQQDAMFTKYMFNSLIYNPAYAGSNGHGAAALLHRSQWVSGIAGAPTTQTLTFHTPLKTDRVGVGFSLINDVIGPTQNVGVNVAYAYRIPLGGNAKLAVGLQGGLENYSGDWSKLVLQTTGTDPSFLQNPNSFLPNFGAGIYFQTPKFYTGFASPQLIEYDLRASQTITTDIWARQARHYYFSIGGAIPINGDALVFKPSGLIKNVGLLASLDKKDPFQEIGAPTEFDVDLSFLIQQTFWVGASFRSAIEGFGSNATSSFDSADLWFSWFMPNGMRFGAAYDYPLTKLSDVTLGSFEVMLGYEFNYRTKKIVTPRYF